MSKIWLVLTTLLLNYSMSTFAQDGFLDRKDNLRMLSWNTKFTDSGKYVVCYYPFNCKGIYSTTVFFPNEPVIVKLEKINYAVSTVEKKPKFLTVHGRVSYEYYYRSKEENAIDPDALQQHTEKVFLNLTFKEQYPFKIAFTARQSNSLFFRNFLDPNIQFDPAAYSKNLKQQAIDKIGAHLVETQEMRTLIAAMDQQEELYNKLKNKLESSSTLQKIVEERERAYLKKINSITQLKAIPGFLSNEVGYKMDAYKQDDLVSSGKVQNMLINAGNKKDSLILKEQKIASKKDSIMLKEEHFKDSAQKIISRLENKKDSLYVKVGTQKDSLQSKYADRYQEEKKKLDSLRAKIDSMQKKYNSLKDEGQKKFHAQKKRLYDATSRKEIEKIAAENGVNTDSSGTLQRTLAALKQLNIGKSMLNYTELTAQNINITGVNVEYNPSWYAAIAVGKVEYRFRDFLSQKRNHNTQYIVMGRVGLGNIRRRAVILSVFKGRKDQSGYNIPDSLKNQINVLGYAVEGIWRKDENTYFTAEAAKTTYPYLAVNRAGKDENGLWKFNDMSNFGINLKAGLKIASTNTKLSGFFRKTGENFQSFSLFTYNTNQTAWLARLDQPFLKQRISLTTMLRQNDFTNPFTDKSFKTTTTFKTFILNVRFPKYPSLSFGYYPGTQLYIVDKETIRENAYYILNAAASYGYQFRKTGMSSSFMLNRYYNKATDSGFVQYKGISYFITHSVFLKKFQLQGGYTYSSQPELKFYTLESSADYDAGKCIKIGAGIKCSQVLDGNEYWGEHFQLAFTLKKIGVLQLQYDKSYLPTSSETLLPVESGRATWIKTF